MFETLAPPRTGALPLPVDPAAGQPGNASGSVAGGLGPVYGPGGVDGLGPVDGLGAVGEFRGAVDRLVGLEWSRVAGGV
ncbi:MAG: hypothetical protein FWD74_02630, partial [Actinomycetia bacterium]|nr:hypothetical protein [Actinomycetes bacterium]